MRTSATLAALVLAAAAGAGCGSDPVCGPGDAGVDTLVADTGDGMPLAYESFTSSPNNDCTPNDRRPTSITIDGTQVGQPSFHITFCVPRPDDVPGGAIDITDDQVVQIIDVNARVDASCVLTLDRTRTPSGTISFAGYCGDGLDPAGYALVLDASVPGTVVCGAGNNTSVDIALSGAVAIDAI